MKGCRPLIGVDGAHLKGPFGCVLLSVVALDGNNGLFPIAFAVVESENRDSWGFFFYFLKEALGGEATKACTITSDRQKGVEAALSEWLPEADRRICAIHLFSNLKTRYSGNLVKDNFWAASHATNDYTFTKAIEQIKEVKPECYYELKGIPFELWSRLKFDPRVKSDEVTSNFVESFNSKLGVLREKPILTLLEGIRRRCMTKIVKKRRAA